METVIWHNPRCSKSRQTLSLLKERGVEPEIVEYLKTPPSADEIERVLAMLGCDPRALMRKQESDYKENGLDDPELTRNELIAAMVTHPKIIERPVVIRGERAALGRPPEAVLEIL